MEQIKEQIFSCITNNETKNYLQENIFNISNSVKGVIKNESNESSSIIVSSLLDIKQQKSSQLQIKSLIKRIEGLIVVDVFWKNIQQISILKSKIKSLKRQNLMMQVKLSNKIKQQNSSFIRQTNKELDLTSQFANHLNFDEHINKASQKLQYQRIKQQLISIIKLPRERKELLLANTTHQYESMLRNITTIENVIQNIEKLHPGEAGLKLKLQQLESQRDEKSIILTANEQLDIKIEQLIKQIKIIQNNQPHKVQINHHQQRISYLTKRLKQFEQFIKQQQQEKHELMKQIGQFNEMFNKEQQINKELLDKIKNKFYQYPALIDQVIKINSQDKRQVEFLLKKIGMSFL